MAGYSIDPQDHLQRAVDLAGAGEVEHFLYAALELRLATEARHADYSRAWDHIPKKVKKDYSVTNVGRALDRAFKTGDQVVQITWHFEGETPISIVYTPVSHTLREIVETLGGYLHAPCWRRAYNRDTDADAWLDKLRTSVLTGIAHLNLALSGQLLGPALQRDEQGRRQVILRLAVREGDPAMQMRHPEQVGRVGAMHVGYHPVDRCVAHRIELAHRDLQALREPLPFAEPESVTGSGDELAATAPQLQG